MKKPPIQYYDISPEREHTFLDAIILIGYITLFTLIVFKATKAEIMLDAVIIETLIIMLIAAYQKYRMWTK